MATALDDEDDDEDELTLLLPSLGPRPSYVSGVDEFTAPAARSRGAVRGDVIGGRYLVEGQIGRGGMGRVLQVRHCVLGKLFALKLPKRNTVEAPGLRERFHREAKLASSLAHDNICSVIDFGEDPTFGLFMVMELLAGVRLDYKVRRDGPLAPRVACDVIGQIAEALRYVHTRGIVHGDIKSENILLTRTPDRRRVAKLLDFGLARTAGDDPSRIEGTPEYLAPERITGAPASPRSDIYALGILFWECLVGRLPFTGMHQLVLQKQLEEPLPLPSRYLDRPLDERGDLIVARATAKHSEDRHPDVSSFLYELRTLSTMLGVEPGRRRVELVRARGGRPQETGPDPGSEVFEHAPVALASVDAHGRVRAANRAFLAFLGHQGGAAGLLLGETAFVDVYPALLEDLKLAAADRITIKQVLELRDVDGCTVDTAVILTPAPGERGAAAGNVHLALHPLAARY